MGNLEKAGIAVVVVLLGVILVVAFVGDPGEGAGAGSSSGSQAASVAGAAGQKPDASKLAPHREVDGATPSKTVQTPLIRDVAGTKKPAAGDDPARSRPPASPPAAAKDVAKDPGPGPAPEPPGRPVEHTPAAGTANRTTPQAAATPRPAADGYPKEVKLAGGDNLWKLVAREYGTALADVMVKRVLAENGIRDARKMQTGATVRLPAPPEGTPKNAAGGETAAAPPGSTDPGAAASKAPSKPPAASAKAAVNARPPSDSIPFDPGPLSFQRETSRSSQSTAGTYVVKSGESLAQIARREMGSEKYVKEIAELNRISDVNRVIAGTRLRMPSR